MLNILAEVGYESYIAESMPGFHMGRFDDAFVGSLFSAVVIPASPPIGYIDRL